MVSRMNSQKNPQRNQTAAQAEIEPDVAAEIRARLDFTHWPVLLMRMPGQGRGRASVLLGMMEEALQRDEPFVVVADMKEYARQPQESDEDRRAAAQWLKRHHEQFFRLCLGNVYVLADPQARAAVLDSGRRQARASGMAVQAAATQHEALALARELLQKAD